MKHFYLHLFLLSAIALLAPNFAQSQVSVNITGNPTACGSVSLTAIGYSGNSYAWSGGATPTTATNTFSTSGTYTVTVTNTSGCSGVCTATASTTVTVNPLPAAVESGGGTVCAGATLPDVIFTFSGTTPYDFTYTNGTTPVSISGHASNTFTLAAAAGTYSITALSDANCTATSLGGNVSVIVNALSTTQITTTNSTHTLFISTTPVYFSNSICEVVANVQPNGSSPISGTTTSKVWIETIQNPLYVKRHYEITPVTNATAATAQITLYFTQAEFDAYNAVNTVKLPINASDAVGKANLIIQKISGTSSNGTGLPATYPLTGTINTIYPSTANIVWNSSANRWEITFNVTGFSGFFVTTQASVLPLELLSFTGKNTVQGNVLHWKTANEVNTKGFNVERLLDNGNWLILGFKTSARFETSPTLVNTYDFTDKNPPSVSYYRLRQMNNDGTETFSKVISIENTHFEGKPELKVYPNPASNHLTIEYRNVQHETANYTIINQLGQVVLQGNLTLDELDISNLPMGIFTLKIGDAQVKFLKQ
jgi:hypothetical protein